MNKEAFLKQLSKALRPLDLTERARTVQYYREILEDRMEEGLSEEAVLAEMEPVEEIAAGILADAAERGARVGRRSGWSLALIILGSPLWLALLAALAAVVAAMYAVAWSVIITLFSAAAALGLSLVAGIAAQVLCWPAYPATGLFLLGAGMVCAALGIALFFPSVALSRWLIRATGQASRRIWSGLVRRKEGNA